MSDRERAVQLINSVPEYKLSFIINMIESMQAYAGEEIVPDDMDLQMIEDAKKENDGQGIAIDDLAAELGVTL